MKSRLLVPLLLLFALPAWGSQDMMLREDGTSPEIVGWTFAGLSGIALLAAANGYTESQKSQEEADKAYEKYQAADNAEDANRYHKKTNSFRNSAIAYESTTNGGFYLSLLFALVSYYSFNPESAPQGPVLISQRGIGFLHRF